MDRFRRLGVRRPIVVHENRTVLVSVGRSGQLRVHRGYAYSSDRTLVAIIRFVNARNRAVRATAARAIQAFSIDSHLRTKRPRRLRPCQPRDRKLLRELVALHARLNAEHFDGRLGKVPFRLSGRMRTRLGEVTLDPRSRRVAEITISRHHIERDGATEVEKTLLHEMVHQWQAESGFNVDHGVVFKRKAVEVGVPPRAKRVIGKARTKAE